jgi:hypothetical protein
MFWMDTDPALEVDHAARVCAASKYSIEDLEQIFWNEVRPALEFNLRSPAGEWTGVDLDWLTTRVLQTHRFGRSLPVKLLHRDSAEWWLELRNRILLLRSHPPR